MCKVVCSPWSRRAFVVTVLGLVGGAPAQGWVEDTARRRRDGTANVTLAVLGAGDRCCWVRLGVLACSMGRGLSWDSNRGGCLGYGFRSSPKTSAGFYGEARECSGACVSLRSAERWARSTH